MDLSGLTAVDTPAEMIAWLEDNCVTPIRPNMNGGDFGTIINKVIAVIKSSEDRSFTGLTGSPIDNTALNDALIAKVDKVTGYQLSQQNYTTSEKTKLATLSEHFKGTYLTFAALVAANPNGSLGDYAYVDQGIGSPTKTYAWNADDSVWQQTTGPGSIPDATESLSGIVELATTAEALARTDDTRAMTALKTSSLILDEKKKVNYQINPISVNEVSILMENAGKVNSVLISGASSAKLKIGSTGIYPAGTQTFPFNYAAGDRVFISYNYNDLASATCNIKLKCQDN
jgi:hypothetical protein